MKLVAFCPREIEDIQRREHMNALDTRWCNVTNALGMLSVIVPNDSRFLRETLNRLDPDLVILSGGGDISEVSGKSTQRDFAEEILLTWAIDRNVPLIGICRGFQAMLAHVGTKFQASPGHVGTRHLLIGQGTREVNSYHHFAAFTAPSVVDVLAQTEDGAIEAARIQKTRRSQLVDATLAWSLLAGVSKSNVLRGR